MYWTRGKQQKIPSQCVQECLSCSSQLSIYFWNNNFIHFISWHSVKICETQAEDWHPLCNQILSTLITGLIQNAVHIIAIRQSSDGTKLTPTVPTALGPINSEMTLAGQTRPLGQYWRPGAMTPTFGWLGYNKFGPPLKVADFQFSNFPLTSTILIT